MAWIGSTYKVTHLAAGQLQVASTPDYASVSLWMMIFLIPTVFFCYRMYRSKSLFPAWGLLIVCFPLFLNAVLTLRTGSITLDKTTNTARFHRPKYFWHDDFLIDLQTIHYAEIRSMRSTTYIAMVLNSGTALTFADSTQAGGQGQAVVAINQYLGVSGRPTQ